MSETFSVGQVLKQTGLTRGTFTKWEQLLALQIPRDQKGDRTFDASWMSYLTTLKSDLDTAGLSVPELLKWERQLELSLPRDAQGRRHLTRDWVRYFQTVLERVEDGWQLTQLVYNIPTPNQLRPQYATASAWGPEY